MQISICAIGKMKSGPETELVERYLDRARKLGKSLGISDIALHQYSESQARQTAARKTDEAELLLRKIDEQDFVILLDEKGKSLSSRDFAQTFAQEKDSGRKSMAFMIGGPDGSDDAIFKRANRVINLSKLTWPHQIVRLLLAEQIYRATTILLNHPYHRD